MEKGNRDAEPKITPDELLNIIGLSPADNLESVNTALAWKSKLIGSQVRGLFGYQRILDSISKDINVFGPWAVAAAWQSALLDTFIRHASLRLGKFNTFRERSVVTSFDIVLELSH